MRPFYRSIQHTLRDGQAVQLAIVIHTAGSSPRGAGAMMARLPDGSFIGTVGGGALEYRVQEAANALFAAGKSELTEYDLGGEALRMACGGVATVLNLRLEPQTAPVFSSLIDADAAGRDCWLCGHWDGSALSELSVCPQGEAADAAMLPNGDFFIRAVRAGTVYLFGGGHVSQALTAVLALSGFRTVVYEDRPEYADPARFADGTHTILGAFDGILERISPEACDYLVVLTRGHEADTVVLRQILRSCARYLGCIGSRAKLALCRRQLISEGFTDAEFDRLHAPIGLKIGAATPEEIAVSIAAELIAVRAGVIS